MRRSLCPSAHRTFSILHTPLRWPSPLLFTKHSTAQSLHSLNHRLHLLGGGAGLKSIRHQTMAYRPKGAACRKVTAIHYVWWIANGQCVRRQNGL